MKEVRFEHGNSWTHLAGVVFALSCIWLIWPATEQGWQMSFGVIFFIVGMFLMFLASTVYHMVPPGKLKRALRKCDHISIYVMIACSYTPIAIGVVGGWLGWLVFGIQWFFVALGVVYKLAAFGKWPRLSLGLYLFMERTERREQTLSAMSRPLHDIPVGRRSVLHCGNVLLRSR